MRLSLVGGIIVVVRVEGIGILHTMKLLLPMMSQMTQKAKMV